MMCLLRKKNMTVQGSYSSYMSLKSGTFIWTDRGAKQQTTAKRKDNLGHFIYLVPCIVL